MLFFSPNCDECIRSQPLISQLLQRQGWSDVVRLDARRVSSLSTRNRFDAAFRVPDHLRGHTPALFHSSGAVIGYDQFHAARLTGLPEGKPGAKASGFPWGGWANLVIIGLCLLVMAGTLGRHGHQARLAGVLLLAAIFLIAGIGKVLAPTSFVQTVEQMNLFPLPLARAAWLLGPLEISLGAIRIVPLRQRIALDIASLWQGDDPPAVILGPSVWNLEDKFMTKRIGCFCGLLTQLFLFAQGASAMGNNTDDIAEHLRAADAVAEQGDLKFVRREYRDGVHLSDTMAIHLQYDASHRYREEQRKRKEPSISIQINDGRNQFIVNPQGTTIGISDKTIGTAPVHLGLGPQANFVLGRGLSTLQNFSVSRSGRDIVVKGLLDGGAPVTAIIDAQHGYIATSISWEGVATWKYGKPIRTSDGCWIPASMTYETGPPDGPVTYRFRFDYLSGSFTKPHASVFQVNLKEFDQIDDNRVPNSPTFFKVPPPGISTKAYTLPASVKTAADLLPFSIQQAEMEARTRGNRPAQVTNRRGSSIEFTVAFLASLLLAFWLLWKRSKVTVSR